MKSHAVHKPRLILCLALTVLPAAAHAQWAYAWANQPAAASYKADPKFSRSSVNQPIDINHLAGAGYYSVRFRGLGTGSAPGGTVQVSSTTGARQCKVESWALVSPDLLAKVRCFTANGGAVDSGFMVLAVRSNISAVAQGYVLADKPNLAAYGADPKYSYNSAGGVNQITRTGTGTYKVRFPNLATGAGTEKGNVQVTALGSGNRMCTLVGWGSPVPSEIVATVQCTAADNPADTSFTLLVEIGDGAPLLKQAYAWGHDPANALYAPLADYANGPGVISIKRNSTGVYRVRFENLGGDPNHIGSAQVTAQGVAGEFCSVVGLANAGMGAIDAEVWCYTYAGAHADIRFTLLVEK